MSKNVLIIGGAGFIGINTAIRFIKSGWKVTILDNLSRKGTDYNLKMLKKECGDTFGFVKADIRFDRGILLEKVFKNDVVFHLAAQVAVTTSIQNPREDFEINALGTVNILEAIRKAGNKPFLIYSSTNKVYGDLEDLKISENDTRYFLPDLPYGITENRSLDFHSPYGCSKGTADQYVHDYSRIYGIPTVVFRQSCIYGHNQFGIEDQGWVVWFLIAHMLGKKISIYGNGKQVRDILFIEDLMDLYVSSVQNIDSVSGKIYNIGGGPDNTLSLLEFIDKLKCDFNFEIKYDFSEIRLGDQKVFVSDNKKIFIDLGWESTTDVSKGLKLTVLWLKNNLDIIKKIYS